MIRAQRIVGAAASGSRRPPGSGRRLVATSGLAIAVFAGTVALVSALRPATTPDERPATGAGFADLAGPGALRRIPEMQRRVAAVPSDWRTWAALGFGYLEQARADADPTRYPVAAAAFERSLAIEKRSHQALGGMSALAAERHHFAEALAWADRARATNPHAAEAHGLAGDALLGLGRYDEAFAAYQRMVDLRPGHSAYVRVAYAWELRGEVAFAADALSAARDAAWSPQEKASIEAALGDLHRGSGNPSRAEHHYRLALAHDPSSTDALAGMASLKAARGDLAGAIADLEVVTRAPHTEHLIALGDLYRAAGREHDAKRAFALVQERHALYTKAGANVTVEALMLAADLGTGGSDALRALRAEWERQPSLEAADALAWLLHLAGRSREALLHSEEALRLGTRNALFHFHRAMIEHALGLEPAAREDLRIALALDAGFSARWAPVAREAYRTLGEH